jgi:hypothetical protein
MEKGTKVNRSEYMLIKLSEECSEVIKACTKSLRFGLDETKPGDDLTNAEKIVDEWIDATVVISAMIADGMIKIDLNEYIETRNEKSARLEKWYETSKEMGIVE